MAELDIVQRITQHINSHQRSKVRTTGDRTVVVAAARVGDGINHTSFWSALAGAVVGALVTAGVCALASVAVAAVGITGGLAAPLAALALGAGATFALSGGIAALVDKVTGIVDEMIGGEPSGTLIKGSPNILVNGRPLAIVDLAESVGCTRHSPPPKIAQGSETVSANGQPVARKGDKTECSATIAEGSPNVFFGSGQATYVEMQSEFTGLQRALLIAVEFVVPPTALFGKGIAKGLAGVGRALATKGPRAGAAVAGRMIRSGARKLASGAASRARGVAQAAKGARAAVGRGLKQVGRMARGGSLGCARTAFKSNTGLRRFTEGVKRFVKGDPIDVLTGQVVEQRTDFVLGQTLPLVFTRSWSKSKESSLRDGLCGRDWLDTFSSYLEVTDGGQQIAIATVEGAFLRFALPPGSVFASNPDYPQYSVVRHRDYIELYHREQELAMLYHFAEPSSEGESEHDIEHEAEAAALGFTAIPDGCYPVSYWLDRFDNSVVFHYDETEKLTTVTHSDGIILRLTYHPSGYLQHIIRQEMDGACEQVLATYTQDDAGLLIESDALLDYHLFYRYDEQGRLIRWSDNDKTWVDYRYDEQDRVIHSVGAEGFYPVWFDYSQPNCTQVRDSQGGVTTYEYDPHLMKPLTITAPSGLVTAFEYDRYGNLLSQTYAKGSEVERRVTFDYLEDTGLVTTFTAPDGNQWHYGYDAQGSVIRVEDPLGRVWSKTERKGDGIAKKGLEVTACFTAPDGSETTLVRNQYGLLTEVQHKAAASAPLQSQLQLRYDPRHRLVESQDAEQRRIQLSYTAHDQVSELTSPNGHRWQYGYTPHAKLTTIDRPNQSQEQQQYDRHGNLTRYTDANGVVWQLKYGAFDLLIEKIDGEGNRWQYEYDKDHVKLNKVTNPKGEHYTYTFTPDGQIATETDFAGNVWHYGYNDGGQLQRVIDGEGNVSDYRYTSNGQLETLSTEGESYQYRYDAVGRVVEIQSMEAVLRYCYDVNDRIIEEWQNGFRIVREYDDVNSKVSRHIYLAGHGNAQGDTQGNTQGEVLSTHFTYNKVGELVALQLPPTSEGNGQRIQHTEPHTLTFRYDGEGNEVSRESNRGFILTQQFSEMNALMQQRAGHEPRIHFDQHELRQAGIQSPSFAALNRTYQYDKALNTIAANDERESLQFVVNGNNQIVTVQRGGSLSESYAYDSCGYVTQQKQSLLGDLLTLHQQDDRRVIVNQDIYQQGHQLNRLNNTHYEYDKAGRLTEKTLLRDGFRQQTTYYKWNGNNQLTEVSISRGKVWYYRYDGLGRRIEKACPELGITTTYVWDGDQLAYQQTETHGRLTHRRHSVFNGWSLLAQQDSYLERDPRHLEPHWREETNYAVTQPNGQPIALFSPEGERTWRQGQHSLWGLRLTGHWSNSQTNPLDPNLLFAGQYYDEESQLAYNRFRYYDPETGSYLTSDPIGLNGGEQPYRYTQNPMDWVDVLGLARCHGLPSTRKAGGTGRAYDPVNGQGLYVLRDKFGNIKYVGRGDVYARGAKHSIDPKKKGLVQDIIFDNNLTKAEAKYLEQKLMGIFGGPQSANQATGLENAIRSYSRSNRNASIYDVAGDSRGWGKEILKDALSRL